MLPRMPEVFYEEGEQSTPRPITTSFKRIAMDIIGPLPRSRSGNQYILVICDYASRYPEAVPL